MATPKKYYVYTLSPPKGSVFYVGVGKGARAFDHTKEARRKDCACRKCKIIRRILRSGAQVKVERVFETDDRAEAYRHEAQLIHQLCSVVHLCNRRGNPYEKDGPPAPDYEALMSYQDFIKYLAVLDIPKRKRDQRLKVWAEKRLGELQGQWRRARRHAPDEVSAIEQEMETIQVEAGMMRQDRMYI